MVHDSETASVGLPLAPHHGASRRRLAIGGVVAVLALLANVTPASAHSVQGGATVFFNPVDWPYYECAATESAIAGGALGQASIWAFHHTNPGCTHLNDRPAGWLAAKVEVWYYNPAAGWTLCNVTNWSYTVYTQSAYSVGAYYSCNQPPTTYYHSRAWGRYYDNGTTCYCYKSGPADISPIHKYSPA